MDPVRVIIVDDDHPILPSLSDLVRDRVAELSSSRPAHNLRVGLAEPFDPGPMPEPSAGRATVDTSTPPSQAGPRGLTRRSHPPSSSGCRYLVLGIKGHRPLSPGNEASEASEEGRSRT
jgi:hypothetical protein